MARAWRVVATAPAAARALTKHPAPAMALAVVLALATVWIAIAASYQTNWPIGFFVGVGSAACYILVRIGALVSGRVRGRPGSWMQSAARVNPCFRLSEAWSASAESSTYADILRMSCFRIEHDAAAPTLVMVVRKAQVKLL